MYSKWVPYFFTLVPPRERSDSPDRSGFVVRAQRADRLACTPDLLLVDLLELTREVLAVRAASIELECLARLGAVAHALVELLKDRPVRRLEDGRPIERATAGGR
jgi:hypothetical protein